jgi:hypothetical protein
MCIQNATSFSTDKSAQMNMRSTMASQQQHVVTKILALFYIAASPLPAILVTFDEDNMVTFFLGSC